VLSSVGASLRRIPRYRDNLLAAGELCESLMH
jgi:hypothetical protein